MTLPTPPTPEAMAIAGHAVKASMQRSPCGNTLMDVLNALTEGEAQLWVEGQSAVVSQFLQDGQLVLSERIWHAGGSWDEVRAIIEKGSEVCKHAGLDRIVIEDTRGGWERQLAPLGFVKKTVLVKEL